MLNISIINISQTHLTMETNFEKFGIKYISNKKQLYICLSLAHLMLGLEYAISIPCIEFEGVDETVKKSNITCSFEKHFIT